MKGQAHSITPLRWKRMLFVFSPMQIEPCLNANGIATHGMIVTQLCLTKSILESIRSEETYEPYPLETRSHVQCANFPHVVGTLAPSANAATPSLPTFTPPGVLSRTCSAYPT